jgi:hypothetical protein
MLEIALWALQTLFWVTFGVWLGLRLAIRLGPHHTWRVPRD